MSKLTDAERQARREADRAKAREAIEALKTSDGWTRWLACRRHFHRYSLANQLLIALQKPEATRVAGFRAWLKLGYCVQRGETAVRVWVPMPPSKQELERWAAAGSDPASKPTTRFKLGPVFDRSQVAPLPPPAEPAPLDPPISRIDGDDLAWAFPRLAALAGELILRLIVERYPASRASVGGYFHPSSSTLSLNKDNAVNHQVKTFVHELSHALLRRDLELTDLSLTCAEEELVCESVAYTVCGSIGLDTAGYSVPYLASWSEGADMEAVERAASTIDRIARRIEDSIGEPPNQRESWVDPAALGGDASLVGS